MTISWTSVATDFYGNNASINHYNVYQGTTPDFIPDFAGASNRVAQPTTTSYTDTGVLSEADSSYYYITAVNTDGDESLVPSALVQNTRLTMTAADGPRFWISPPYSSPLANASDIAGLSADISKVIRFDPASQSETVWDASAGTGTDFALTPGEAYGVEITADTILNLIGVQAPSDIALNHNPSDFNRQWIGLPQPSAYDNASDLLAAITDATKVAIHDPANDTYKSWFDLQGTLMGEDFPISPGVGVVVTVQSASTFSPDLTRPEADASSDPDSGYESITVTLTANATDADGTIVSYQWDVDGDGVFDDTGQELTHTYVLPGTYRPTVLVTDDEGHRAAAFATVSVESLNVGLSQDKFSPYQGETMDISYMLPESGEVTIKIYDGDGQLVRTLVSNDPQTSGAHNTTWNGLDGNGDLVADGAYFVVIEFTAGGVMSTYDLRLSGGGIEISDEISGISVSDTLSPLEGQYVNIDYTLPEAAAVSIVIKDLDGNVIRNLQTDANRIGGSHTEIWDGSDNNGDIVEPGTAFTVSVTATSLGGNSVLADGVTPELSQVSAAPLRFSPSENPYGATPKSTVEISFDLNKTADITATVYDASGNVVRTINQTGLTAGTNQVSWNGRNSSNILVVDGNYTVRLQAQDSGGNTSQTFNVQTEVFY